MLDWILRYVRPELAFLIAILILILYFWKTFEEIFGTASKYASDGFYIVHNLRVSKEFNRKSKVILGSLEDDLFFLYRPFKEVFWKFRNRKGEIIQSKGKLILISRVLAREVLQRIVELFSKQPLDTNIPLGGKTRRVIDLMVMERYIQGLQIDESLDNLFQLYKQDAFKIDPSLFRLSEFVRVYVVENDKNYKLLKEIKARNKDFVVMILNSIERGILNGTF